MRHVDRGDYILYISESHRIRNEYQFTTSLRNGLRTYTFWPFMLVFIFASVVLVLCAVLYTSTKPLPSYLLAKNPQCRGYVNGESLRISLPRHEVNAAPLSDLSSSGILHHQKPEKVPTSRDWLCVNICWHNMFGGLDSMWYAHTARFYV